MQNLGGREAFHKTESTFAFSIARVLCWSFVLEQACMSFACRPLSVASQFQIVHYGGHTRMDLSIRTFSNIGGSIRKLCDCNRVAF